MSRLLKLGPVCKGYHVVDNLDLSLTLRTLKKGQINIFMLFYVISRLSYDKKVLFRDIDGKPFKLLLILSAAIICITSTFSIFG